MSEAGDPRDELLELAARFRHLREEHRRAPAGGSVRRGLEADVRAAEAHAERRIGALVADPEDRAGWLAHLHHGAPAPDRPEPGPPPAHEPAPERPEGRRPWPR